MGCFKLKRVQVHKNMKQTLIWACLRVKGFQRGSLAVLGLKLITFGSLTSIVQVSDYCTFNTIALTSGNRIIKCLNNSLMKSLVNNNIISDVCSSWRFALWHTGSCHPFLWLIVRVWHFAVKNISGLLQHCDSLEPRSTECIRREESLGFMLMEYCFPN